MKRRADDHAASADGEPVEIELKLGVDDPAAVRKMMADPPSGGLASFVPDGEVIERVIVDRYLDTSATGGRLEGAGLRVRLRADANAGADGTILGVKSSGSQSAGVVRRLELEGPATTSLDPQDWPDSAARRRVTAVVAGQTLREIAALRQQRMTRDFRRDEARVEVSLDAMTALAGSREIALRTEIEVELLSGTPEVLHEIAGALMLVPGIRTSDGSKFDFARDARAAAPPTRILVLCIGNSCRSQMAEAFLSRDGGASVAVTSAGTRPSPVRPMTISVLAERGIDWSAARSKAMTDFLDQPFDVVVTVCAEAAEACPVFPGGGRRVHVPFDDPAVVTGSDADRLAAYRRIRDEIEAWAADFVETEFGA